MGLTRREALRIMGLEEGCTTKEVRDRFKKLALKWHPDKNIDNPDEAQKKFQAISAAYTKLVSSEEDDDIPTDTLREMFSEIWHAHNRSRPSFGGEPHLFCDCESCLADWEDISLDDFIGSDSDPDDDFYYDDTLYADDLLKQFGDRLYHNFNGPSRAGKKTRSSWTGSSYKGKVSAEEASRHADELLKAEEEEKRQAEKKKQRNKKRKESKKRRKAKQHDNVCISDTKTQVKENECDIVSEDKVDIVPKSNDKTVQPELSKAPPETKGGNKVARQQQKPAEVQVKTSMADEHLDERDEDSIPSEDELDFSSAFVKQAEASAAARAKSKEKLSTTDKYKESQKTSKGQKPTPSPDSGQGEPQPIAKNKSNQIRNPRTVDKEPSHSKEPDINGDIPVISTDSTSNGYEASSYVDEEDDLSPVDMNEAKFYEANIPQSKQLAGEGNRAAKAGEFDEAVRKYSDAITLYPFDHRYFGNRSFCYDYLQEYSKALADANSALRIDITWAKGFYRRGRGLAGLKRYEAAVTAFTRALELKPDYTEAGEQLEAVQLEQLQSMGFPIEASKAALAEHHTVAAAVDAMVNRTGGRGQKKPRAPDNYTPVYNHSGFEIPPRMLPQTTVPQNCALWVGNINSRSLTQPMLTKLFQRHGQVGSVRVLYERRCAFVNYIRPESAAMALKKLQGYTIGGCSLVLRYPENAGRPVASPSVQKPKRRVPVSEEEECRFWRSTGCTFGDQCRYLHLPESRGVDTANEYVNTPSQ